MATIPTPEVNARRLLAIISAEGPGAVMTLQKLCLRFGPDKPAEFTEGLKYAFDREWLLPRDQDAVVLSGLGFAEA